MRKVIMSTMWSTNDRWNRLVDNEEVAEQGTPSDMRRLWRMTKDTQAAILLGSVTLKHRYRDLVLAAMIQAGRRPRPRILITDATWEPQSRTWAARTKLPASVFALPIRAFIKLIDGPNVRYAVLSTDEVKTFPQTWGVDPERVVFTPFPATISADIPHSRGDYVFAGGNSLRDHDLLQRALGGTDLRTIVATSHVFEKTPSTFDVRFVPHEEYVQLLAGAGAVVVNLAPSVRSSGQQSYLNAMLMEKPTIVTDVAGVRDYIEDGVTGVIVPVGDAAALRAAVEHAMDPANAQHYAEMGRKARQVVRDRFMFDDYFGRYLLDAVGVPADA